MDSIVDYLANGTLPTYLGTEPVTSVLIRLTKLPDFDHLDFNQSASSNSLYNSMFQQHLTIEEPLKWAKAALKGAGRLFYLVDREETTFQSVQDVPQYFKQAWPYFVLFMILENILLFIEKKPTFRLNDSITSLSHGMLQETGRLVFRGGESFVYIYIYEHFRLCDLPWDHPLTWYGAAVGVDFCYYWVHRACHEVHVLWAQHQVHHSSEEFNLAVGLRQSIVQGWCGFIFYLPLAFVLPPSHFITHQQFNILYQFWIHTKTVKTLGPFEYILNTPNHHRVHHGSNIYCLDKNYGGVLIIWDRIFGTFGEEKSDEEIIYGLVFNQPSFNILHLQTFYTKYVAEKFSQMDSWSDKLAAVFYGPSWQPGKPRLGLEEDKIKVEAREVYDVKLPVWCNIYLLTHFCVVIFGFHSLLALHVSLSPIILLLFVLYIIGSLTTIGLLFDNKPYACVLELFRCMVLVTIVQRLPYPGQLMGDGVLLASEVFYLLSGFFWLLQSVKVLQISLTSDEKYKRY